MDPVTLALASQRIQQAVGAVVSVSSNLFDLNHITRRKTIDSSTGELVDHNDYVVSNHVHVNPSARYAFYMVTNVGFYAEDGSFIQRRTLEPQATVHILTTPANASTMRLTVRYNYIAVAQVNAGEAIDEPQSYPKKLADDIRLPGTSITLDGLRMHMENVADTSASPNLIDSSMLEVRKAFNTRTGESLDGVTDALTTPPIFVKPNTTYSGNFYRVGEWDAEGNYLGFHENTTQFTTTPRTAYVRVWYQGWKTDYKTPRLNEGETLLPFVEAHRKFEPVSGLAQLNRWPYAPDIAIPATPFVTQEQYDVEETWGDSTHDDVYNLWDTLLTLAPTYVSRELLGNEAGEGLPVYAYHFNPVQPNAEYGRSIPRLFFTCGTHGYEKTSSYVMYQLMKQIIEKWSHYPHLETLRYNVAFTIIPVLNPYGWNRSQRTNSNGVDINRNFPIDWVQGEQGSSTYGGPEPMSELESQFVKDVLDLHWDIRAYYDYHNFGGVVGETENFLWVPDAPPNVQHVAQRLISMLTRLWRSRYTFIPGEPYFAGYTQGQVGGTIPKFARSYWHVEYSSVFETCDRWHLDSNGAVRDQKVLESSVETLGNWMLINLRGLIGQL